MRGNQALTVSVRRSVQVFEGVDITAGSDRLVRGSSEGRIVLKSYCGVRSWLWSGPGSQCCATTATNGSAAGLTFY